MSEKNVARPPCSVCQLREEVHKLWELVLWFAQLLERHIQEERGRKGRAPGGFGRLTKQERVVCDLAIIGFTNRQIAEALNISVFTAKNHMAAILAKLGVQSRRDLAKYPESEDADAAC